MRCDRFPMKAPHEADIEDISPPRKLEICPWSCSFRVSCFWRLWIMVATSFSSVWSPVVDFVVAEDGGPPDFLVAFPLVGVFAGVFVGACCSVEGPTGGVFWSSISDPDGDSDLATLHDSMLDCNCN